ncbi:hypothetical protein EIMP300_51140 [Escherichia coli]|uniref:HTH tetR-type domain-containing protein n=1 Tax=Escherichia coli TaxID=562 RepID=A0A8S0FT25_ECOLX|nr:hypothetical protein EIMP300_51140 [Escherichia coli]
MMDNMQTEAQPTRTRILNAAREIFSENGFHSASMKAICKSCAISPGTLYHHFISKEALIQAIILQDQERALARFREPIEGIHFVDYMVESIVSLTHEAFGSFLTDDAPEIFRFIGQYNERWWSKLWRKGCVTHRSPPCLKISI